MKKLGQKGLEAASHMQPRSRTESKGWIRAYRHWHTLEEISSRGSQWNLYSLPNFGLADICYCCSKSFMFWKEKISSTEDPFSYAEGSAHFLLYVKSRNQTVKCYWPHSGWIFLPQLAWGRKSLTAMSAGQPDLDSSSLRVPTQTILHCVKLTIKKSWLQGICPGSLRLC